MPITSPEEYLAAAPDAAHAWLRTFWGHVREKAPDLPVVMFRQVPMFQFGKGYLQGYAMFTATKDRFVVHCLEFDLVTAAREQIKGSSGGKGSVGVKYDRDDARDALLALVDEVLRRRESA